MYILPEPKPIPDEDEDGDDDLEFYPDVISDHTVNNMADCMELLSDPYEQEVKDHNATQAELENSKKTEAKLQKAEAKAKEINIQLKKEMNSLQTKNVIRRLQRRDAAFKEEEQTNQKLNKQIEKLEVRIQELQRLKKNKGGSRRYFSTSLGQNKESKVNLKKQIQLLEKENENDLKCTLDDVMNEKEVGGFENGKYTNDIRLVCFELHVIARGVGSKHVSEIIRIVLRDVGKIQVGRLPKPTLIRYLAVEQAMLSKESARSKIQDSETPVTLHTDGTTKKRKGYVTMLASTSKGTVGMSLHDVDTESADTLLQDTQDALDDLVRLNLSETDTNEVHEILAKVKNTMTDRCIVNKAYIQKLEKWRASVLPEVTTNWDALLLGKMIRYVLVWWGIGSWRDSS